MSMAAGEYVSVSRRPTPKRPTWHANARNSPSSRRSNWPNSPQIYIERGVEPELALQVADQMTAKDALARHARDELGISAHAVARPIQAALTSAITFAAGAAVPLIVALVAPTGSLTWTVSLVCLVGLAALGALGARAGGADVVKPTIRVVFWGAVAMATTAAIGALVGRAV